MQTVLIETLKQLKFFYIVRDKTKNSTNVILKKGFEHKNWHLAHSNGSSMLAGPTPPCPQYGKPHQTWTRRFEAQNKEAVHLY